LSQVNVADWPQSQAGLPDSVLVMTGKTVTPAADLDPRQNGLTISQYQRAL
jgi:hypothetical protein